MLSKETSGTIGSIRWRVTLAIAAAAGCVARVDLGEWTINAMEISADRTKRCLPFAKKPNPGHCASVNESAEFKRNRQ